LVNNQTSSSCVDLLDPADIWNIQISNPPGYSGIFEQKYDYTDTSGNITHYENCQYCYTNWFENGLFSISVPELISQNVKPGTYKFWFRRKLPNINANQLAAVEAEDGSWVNNLPWSDPYEVRIGINCSGPNSPIPPTQTPIDTPIPTAIPCPTGSLGNLNCDTSGTINEIDINILLRNWSPTGPAPTPTTGQYKADLNNDNKVDEIDYGVVLRNWKT
jgi:hypothetical protein